MPYTSHRMDVCQTAYFLILALLSIRVFSLNCVFPVASCPCSKEEWERRSTEFNCTELKYTCILTFNNSLVEACVVDYPIRPSALGCPFIRSCYHSIPTIPIEAEFKPCPSNSSMCPPFNHTGYSLTELYKFPDCILRNFTLCSDTYHISTDDRHIETLPIVLGLVIPGCLCLIVGNIIIYHRRRNSKEKDCNTLSSHPLMADGDTAEQTVDRDLLEIDVNEDPENLASEDLHHYQRLILTKEAFTENTDTQCTSDLVMESEQESHTTSYPCNTEKETTDYIEKQTVDDDDDDDNTMESDVSEDYEMLLPSKVKQDTTYKGMNAVGDPLMNKELLDTGTSTCKSDEGTIIDNNVTESDEEPNIKSLKERLLEKIEAMKIPLMPLQRGINMVSLKDIFSSVIIREKATENSGMSTKHGNRDSQEKVTTPNDILTKYGKPVRNVVMFGKAAHGKTTFCKWLLQKWRNGHTVNDKTPGVWETELRKFDFAFYLPLDTVDKSKESITGIICQDFSETDTYLQPTLRLALSSGKYRCLIIIDGLDKWQPNQSVVYKLKHRALPNIDNMSNCVIFYTMRPSISSHVIGVMQEEVRVIEIKGFNSNGIKSAIKKVLTYTNELQPGSDEFKAKRKEIMSKLDDKTWKSLVRIPLLAIICPQIWLDKKEGGDCLTIFYSKMIDMLVERSRDNIKLQIQENIKTKYIPKVLSDIDNIRRYFSTLLKLGKVAYDGLFSDEEYVQCQESKLVNEIGREGLQFAIDVGLISLTRAPRIMGKYVSVSFFHKSVQKFLAALYIVNNNELHVAFRKHLDNIEVIIELSDVIRFICGMCPSLGSAISQRVVSISDNDKEILEYRKLPDRNSRIEELYKQQISWYSELKAQKNSTDESIIFYVSDIHLCLGSDIYVFHGTRGLMSDEFVDIRSLFFQSVPTDGEGGITDIELNKFLSKRSLDLIFIDAQRNRRSINTINMSTLKTLFLRNVTIKNVDILHHPVQEDIAKRQTERLGHKICSERPLGRTFQTTYLQRIHLTDVYMPESGWDRLFKCFIDIGHEFDVILTGEEINSEFLTKMKSSPQFSLEKEKDAWFKFTRVL